VFEGEVYKTFFKIYSLDFFLIDTIQIAVSSIWFINWFLFVYTQRRALTILDERYFYTIAFLHTDLLHELITHLEM